MLLRVVVYLVDAGGMGEEEWDTMSWYRETEGGHWRSSMYVCMQCHKVRIDVLPKKKDPWRKLAVVYKTSTHC